MYNTARYKTRAPEERLTVIIENNSKSYNMDND